MVVDRRIARSVSLRFGGGALRKVRRVVAYPLRRWPWLAQQALTRAALLALFIALANAYVLLSADQHSTGEVSEVPAAEVAIVPGAVFKPNGEMSAMLADRVQQAATLWHADRVGKILVCGDHGQWE